MVSAFGSSLGRPCRIPCNHHGSVFEERGETAYRMNSYSSSANAIAAMIYLQCLTNDEIVVKRKECSFGAEKRSS